MVSNLKKTYYVRFKGKRLAPLNKAIFARQQLILV